MNNRGPSIEPWGMPHDTEFSLALREGEGRWGYGYFLELHITNKL